jgi:hypothetical protein
MHQCELQKINLDLQFKGLEHGSMHLLTNQRHVDNQLST